MWRALNPDDAPALARLYAAVEAVDDTGENYAEDDLLDLIQEVGDDSLAVVEGDEILGFTCLQRRGGQLYAEGAVVPAARGRGLGRRLLAWAEERAAGTPLHVDAHTRNPGKQALVRAAGYEPVRWFHTMLHTLGEIPELPPIPPGLALVPYTADRDEAVRLAHGEAFAEHWGARPPDPQRWAIHYTGARTFRPDVSRLVLDGEEVAGYLLTHCWEADTLATGVREAFVNQLGVRARWRRRGLGLLLLIAALHAYRAAGYGRSTLTVDTGNTTGALGVYERAGYAVTGGSVVWARE